MVHITQLKDALGQRKRLISLSAAVVLITAGGLAWRFSPQQRLGRDLSNYTVETERGTLPGVVSANGELQAKRSVNVSPKRSGLLKELYVDQGDNVKKGEMLARMDSGDYNDRLDELKALERKERVEYETRKKDHERRDNLYQQGAISADDASKYRRLYLTSRANLAAAQERVQQRITEGKELLIRAPFSGVITARYAEPGAFVTPTTAASATAGATSSSLVELSEGIEVTAKVPESDIGRIRIGQEAVVRVDAFPDQRFVARVSEIAPRAQKTDNVISFEVKLNLMSPSPQLLIGMSTDVDFQTGKTAPSTLVPTVAIVTEKGKPGVLLVGKKNQPRFQTVELGTSSGSKTAILSGLNPGTRIFIDLPPWAKPKRD
ncbi:MAG TPA: efflux RND transporter periplasmic adaptor subunit [Prochlorococcus sp.]|nr:efflux RND transporter periplasmic adaptor subunit [Prochlorococcus sp.]